MTMHQLKENGIDLSDPYIGDHKTFCPQCRGSRKSKNKHDKPLSVTINPDGAVWKCHNCEWSGGFSTSSPMRFERRLEVVRPKEPKEQSTSQGINSFFANRSISGSTIEAFGIYRSTQSFGSDREPCIAFPYRVDGELVNVKYRTQDKKFRQEKNAERTLYNIDRIKSHWDLTGEKEVIFVEGEMDVLACFEAGLKNAVTLPDGAPKEAKFDASDKRFNALASCEWLHDAERVVIATDADSAGQALALELVHRFGKDRCYRVTWPDTGEKDANEVLVSLGVDGLRSLISSAEPYPIDGLYRVRDYRSQVFDIYDGKVEQPLSTGFPFLDEIYKVMPSTFHVITGVPNHGKSNFLDQLAVNMAQAHGWKFSIFSPEHSVPQHLRRLSEKVIQRPFDKGPNVRMDRKDVADALEFLEDHFYFIECTDDIPTIDWLLAKAKASCLRYGVRGFIFDPYNEINADRSGGKREDEHIRDLISKCKSFCRQHDVVIWMVAHPAKMARDNDGVIPAPTLYDISGAAHWNNMADVGLVVHRDFENDVTRVITRKVREQGLYGHIGESFFKYASSTHCYEEWNPDERRSSAYGGVDYSWQND